MLSRLMDDMRSAMKAGEKSDLRALRNLIGKVKAKQIDNGKDLTTDECIKVMASAAKQLKDSIQQYKDGGRDDLAANEEDLKSMDIRHKLTGFTGNEVVTVKINKEQLNLKKGESDWLIGKIPAGVIHQGQNFLKVKLEKSKSSLILSAVEVKVKYKHFQ